MAEKILTEVLGSPPQQDIHHYRGDTFVKMYRFKNSDGTPKDIAGSEFEFQVKIAAEAKAADPLVEAAEEHFILSQSDDAAGVAGFEGSDTVTIEIPWELMLFIAGQWVYDFRRTFDGRRLSKVAGTFFQHDDVSQKTPPGSE